MPPKKRAADSADPPQPTSSKDPAEETSEKKSASVALRKLTAHPTTAIMVREALTALDSRKGVSSQAIQSFIKQKYPSVDVVRLKHLVRRALIRGMETGTLVRPVNSSVTTGALGRFRLAPKVKVSKPKSENADPNAQKSPKAAKDGVNLPEKAGAIKKRNSAKGEIKSTKNAEPAEKPDEDKDDAAPSKVAPAKKPKAKKAEVKVSDEGNSNSTKTKATKRPKEPKMGKVQSKAAEAGGDAHVPKTTGKRGKKTE